MKDIGGISYANLAANCDEVVAKAGRRSDGGSIATCVRVAAIEGGATKPIVRFGGA